jgi:pimeloyl-ACP methyl ester carboxylesterase
MLILVLLVVAGLMAWSRRWLLQMKRPGVHREDFPGTIHEVGQGLVGHRPAQGTPRAVVVAIHGFMEDWRYFGNLYSSPDLELALVNNSLYHSPDQLKPREKPSWAKANSFAPGTIAHDAHILCEALERFGRPGNTRVHGHSRGGAVVLEAALQRPELFADVDVVLEAPLLPGARPYPATSFLFSPFGAYLPPFIYGRLSILPTGRIMARMNPPVHERKIRYLDTLSSNPSTWQVVETNVRDMAQWVVDRRPEKLAALPKGTVLLGERDMILDNRSLKAALAQASHLAVIQPANTSHFVTLDRPEVLPPPGHQQIAAAS